MKHCHCLYNTLRVTETGHSRIHIYRALTLFHVKRPELYGVLAVLSAKWLK